MLLILIDVIGLLFLLQTVIDVDIFYSRSNCDSACDLDSGDENGVECDPGFQVSIECMFQRYCCASIASAITTIDSTTPFMKIYATARLFLYAWPLRLSGWR